MIQQALNGHGFITVSSSQVRGMITSEINLKWSDMAIVSGFDATWSTKVDEIGFLPADGTGQASA